MNKKVKVLTGRLAIFVSLIVVCSGATLAVSTDESTKASKLKASFYPANAKRSIILAQTTDQLRLECYKKAKDLCYQETESVREEQDCIRDYFAACDRSYPK